MALDVDTLPLSPHDLPHDPDSTARHVLAVLFSAAFVAVLSQLFSLAPLQAHSADLRGDTLPARVVMLPLDRRGVGSEAGERPPWMDSLYYWLVLMHPSIMSIPVDLDPLLKGTNIGFSQLRLHEFERPHKALTVTGAEVRPYDLMAYTPPVMVSPVLDPIRELEWVRRFRPPELVAPEATAVAPAGTVYITDLYGRPQTDVPPIAVSDVLAASAALRVRGPSIVTVFARHRVAESAAGGLRVQLDRSCGNSYLDTLAMTHFRSQAVRLQSQTVDVADASAWLDQPHQYVIVWRYVPGVVDERQATVPAITEFPAPTAPAPNQSAEPTSAAPAEPVTPLAPAPAPAPAPAIPSTPPTVAPTP